MKENTKSDFDNEITILEYFHIMFLYKWLVLSIFLFILGITILYTFTRPNIYESKSIVLLDDRNPTHDFMMFSNRGISRTSINNTVEILYSRPVLSLAIDYMHLYPEASTFPLFIHEQQITPDYVISLRKKLNITTSREKDTIEISYQSINPTETMVIVNAVADAMILQNTQFARLEFTTAREFLESQLTGVTQRLQVSEENLRDYKIDSGVFQLTTETDHLIERSAIANANLLSAQADYNIAKQNLEFLQSELAVQDSLLLNVALSISTPYIDQLKSEVVRIMSRITTLTNNNDYSHDHPEIVRLQRTLDNATKTLDEEIQKTLSIRAGSIDVFGFRNDLIQNISSAQINENLLFARVNSYQIIVDSFEQRLSLLPDAEMELARLQRNYKIDEHIFSILAENLEDARVAEQARIGNLRIIERAIVPDIPVKPNKKLNLLTGVLLGFIISISIAVLLHTNDTKIRTIDDVEKHIKYNVLGTIPLMDLKKNTLSLPLSFVSAPKSPEAEAFRTLRTNIIIRKSNGPVSIVISSSGQGEGKSTSIANLAISLAHMNSKIILVDFDMRRPTLNNLFNLDKEQGASDFLSDSSILLDNIIKNTEIKNLDIITSGVIPHNPSELISSERTDELINMLKSKYDYILFDMPPIIAVTDPLIMAKKVDIFILVLLANYTDKKLIKRTLTMLENININITGVIVNGVVHQKYYRGYSHYYYHYNP